MLIVDAGRIAQPTVGLVLVGLALHLDNDGYQGATASILDEEYRVSAILGHRDLGEVGGNLAHARAGRKGCVEQLLGEVKQQFGKLAQRGERCFVQGACHREPIGSMPSCQPPGSDIDRRGGKAPYHSGGGLCARSAIAPAARRVDGREARIICGKRRCAASLSDLRRVPRQA